LVLLIPFLKDSQFFTELLNVLSELLKFGDDWQRAFCELNIEVYKIGNSKNFFSNLKIEIINLNIKNFYLFYLFK
jgi:hypothetical protein